MLNKLKLVDDTRIERLIRCCILLGLCVTLAGVFIVMLLHSFQDSQQISCKTDTCRKISRELFRQLDKNVSACTDFTEHVCGKKPGLFQNNEETHYTNIMKHILDYYQENHNTNVAEVPLFVDAIEFYRSCINQESRNAARYADLFDIYNEIGGWPLLQNKPTFSSYGFRFERPLINLYRKIKRNYFFDLEITTDQLGSKVVFIKKYSRVFKNDARWIFKYKEHIKEIVRLIHPNPDELDEIELEKNVDELVNFEQKLNDVSFENPLTIELKMFNITSYEPNMDWSLVFSSMVENVRIFYPEYNEVISIGRDTTRHINKLLRSGKVFLNYLGWQVTQHYASFTTITLMKMRENFLQETDDDKSDLIREEEEKPIVNEDSQNSTIKTPSTDEFDQVSSNLKEICSKQTIIEFQTPIDFVFKKSFLNKNYEKLSDMLKSIVSLVERKLENTIWSDEALTGKLSEKLHAVQVNEILQRSPKSTYCYEYNFAIEDAKSFVSSVVHIESFNHLNDLCMQAYQKESKKKYNNERTRNFELETRTYIPLTNVDSTAIPNFFLISRFGTLISSYLLKNVILTEENASLMSYELKHLFNSKLNCFKEQVLGKNYEESEMSYNGSIEQFIIQSESVNLAQELFSKFLSYNNDHMLESQQVSQVHNLNQLFFISYVHGYCHYFNSKTQHNQLFKTLVNFSTIKNSQIFFDVFNCVPTNAQHTVERCTLF